MTLLYLGLLVLVGFACARLLRKLHLPAVTGYLLVGVVMGPSAFHLVGADTLGALKPLGSFALALIFFLLGEEFRLSELRELGPRYLAITVIQALTTFAVVAGLALLAHAPLEISLLLGAIAGTTDPAATLAVIREQRGRGELVTALLSVVALNSLVEMLLFTFAMPVVECLHRGAGSFTFQALLLGPAREIGVSLLVGIGLAIALRTWSVMPHGRETLKLPTLGLILLGSGMSEAWHLSILLVMLSFGAAVAHLVPFRIQIFDMAKAMEGPLLVMFFTLSGAGLHVQQLAALGWIGAAYVGGRIVGKLAGASLGATVAGSGRACRRYLGFGLLPQASMAIGLAYLVQAKFPDLAGPVLPVCLGSVVIFEVLGPLLTRMAILRTSETPAASVPEVERSLILPQPSYLS